MTMHELQRRAYLDAMGIVSYVPRFVLPHAAPSKACVLPIRNTAIAESAQAAPVSPPALDPASRASAVDVAPAGPVRPPRPEMPSFADERDSRAVVSKRSVDATEADSPSVAFTAQLVGSALGLLFLTDQNMAPADKRLLANIAAAYSRHACDDRDCELQAGQFRWPVARSSSLSQDADAARDAFSAHLLARAEREALRGLVFFGDGLQTYVDRPLLSGEGLTLITAVGLPEMSENADAKAALWRELRSLPR